MPKRLALLVAAAAAAAGPAPPAAARGFDFDEGWGARGAATADLDGDGEPDLVLAQSFLTYGPQRGRLVVFLGDPAAPGRWRTRTEVAVGANPLDLRIADLDGDGRPDIATANAADGTATVLLQSPSGSFARADYPAAAGALGIASGDLDRDGLPDLAVAGAARAVILLQDGASPGTFLPPAVLASGVSPSCIAVADMDGASGNDVVLGHYDFLQVYLQDAAAPGTFPAATPLDLPGQDLERMVAADLDGNGRTDIACAMRGLPYGGAGKGLGLLLQDAVGGLQFAPTVVDQDQPLKSIEIQDMDADGTPDLLCSGGGRVLWYRQDPAARGSFKRAAKKGVPASEGGITGADFDGDGLVDAAVAFYRPYLMTRGADNPKKFRAPKAYRGPAE